MPEDKTLKSLKVNSFPVYILGIPARFRGRELRKNLEKFDFKCDVISGIDAKLISSLDASKLVNRKAAKIVLGRDISIGEACCVLVHLDAYKEFLKSNYEWMMILEDDAILMNSKLQALSIPRKVVKPTILKLSNATDHDLYCEASNLYDDLFLMKNGFRKLKFPTSMAHSYMINRSAATIAVRKSFERDIHFTADWPYLWDYKIAFWQSREIYFLQEGESIIDEDKARIEIISAELRVRNLKSRIFENILDFSLFNSVRLYLYGGDGFAYFKSRPLVKLKSWFDLAKGESMDRDGNPV